MRVEVGDDSQVAELCSIRDADHGIRVGIPIRDQALQSTPVLIGNDVWIGRGVAVLRGSVIEDGAIVGANSLVRGQVGARVEEHTTDTQSTMSIAYTVLFL